VAYQQEGKKPTQGIRKKKYPRLLWN